MTLLPPGVLSCSDHIVTCLYCGRLFHGPVCEYCLRQLPLVKCWILEACILHAQTLPPLIRSLKRLGISELMVETALMVLVIDQKLEVVRP